MLNTYITEQSRSRNEKLMDNMSELDDLSESAVFVCGFKYGSRTIAEALRKKIILK